MLFWVKLIEVANTKNQDARNDLYANCTHVENDYWLYEGDEDALHNGIEFHVVGEKAIEAYGDMSSGEIKRMVRDEYKISALPAEGE